MVLAQVCGATPAWQDPLLCVFPGGKGGAWPSPGLSINGPSTLVLGGGTALNDSVLSCLLLGHSQAQPKGHFSQGYQPLPSKPGFGMCWGAAHKDPAEHVDQGPWEPTLQRRWAEEEPGLGPGQRTTQCSQASDQRCQFCPVTQGSGPVRGTVERPTHSPFCQGGREGV